jgi:20S proteasome subunit alpha 4
MREFLEKEWTEGLTEADALKLTVKALLEVVDSGSKNMEVAVVRNGAAMDLLGEDALLAVTDQVLAEAEAEKNAAAASGTDAMTD